ncbi:MAG: HSP20 family protein [Pseudoalteromonas tetraodonis]|jgi:HSP20 family protein
MDKPHSPDQGLTPFSELDTTKRGSGLPPESIDSSPPEWQPTVDIGEDENEYLLVAAIPGLAMGDVEVKGANGIIEISGTAKLSSSEQAKRFVKLERPLGDCHRAFAMPADADLAALRYDLSDGILHVHVPKARTAARVEMPLTVIPAQFENPLPGVEPTPLVAGSPTPETPEAPGAAPV